MRRRIFALLASCALALAFIPFHAVGQDASPSPASSETTHPVAVHEGTCDDPVAQPAAEVADTAAIGAGSDDPEVVGEPTGPGILEANATIDGSLDDFTGAPHVIAVHASATDYDTIVACGQIAGVKEDGKLVVALTPVDESGVTGIATLDEDTSGVLGLGDDELKITVYLIHESESPATPAA